MTADRDTLKRTFDEDAERYDRARPGYPDALVEDLAGAIPGRHVVEVGAGTGQLTVPLARRGFAMTAVELGAGLAAVARRNLEPYPESGVEVGAFEDWRPPRRFDAVVAATCWHWLDPAVRLHRAADALRGGGVLAIVAGEHVAGGAWDEEFTAAIQRCYERWDEDTPPGLRMTRPEDVPTPPFLAAPEPGAERFHPPAWRRYTQDVAYTTERYLDVLLTFSGHRAMTAPERAGLLGCIAALIDARGGRVVKRMLLQLGVAVAR